MQLEIFVELLALWNDIQSSQKQSRDDVDEGKNACTTCKDHVHSLGLLVEIKSLSHWALDFVGLLLQCSCLEMP